MGYAEAVAESATVFTVEPEAAPSAGPPVMGLVLGVGSPFALIMLFIAPMAGLIFGAALSFLGKWVGGVPSRRRPEPRPQSTFRVSPANITTGAISRPVRDIHRPVIRNLVSDKMNTKRDEIVAGNANFAAGRNVAMRMNAGLEKLSYRVDVESGGSATTLGAGLTEAGAFGLAKDIQAITGLELHQ